jgi:hypothetical protein
MKKPLLLLLFAALVFENAYAQKLPNKQEASVRIPANVKIDGKATEWGDKFQAYNNATDLSYTLANNNEDLYLVIQTEDRLSLKKIIDRGLTLSVKKPRNGKAANFTFPYISGDGRLTYSFKGNINLASVKITEANSAYNNKLLKEKHKFIKVEGVEGVDSLVSVYNEKGIQAAEVFDNKQVYTIEMKVKLKLIGLSANDGEKISYQLKVNPISTNMPVVDINEVHTSDGKLIPEESKERVLAEMTKSIVRTYGGTDFWGEYTLAK